MSKDRMIRGAQTAIGTMIVTQASTHDGTVYISKSEKSFVLRCLVVRNDGSKCEFFGSEFDFRAAREALNRFAAEDKWDTDEEKP